MLLCGEVHYFRVPRGLWGDRLLKVKRAGLNCVNTYFAWNYHEEEPGVFNFSGEKDVDAYLTEAERLGLRIIARVGPYICSEWDNGGHPDWLISRGLIPRSLDQSYWPYAERWLMAILPYIVKHQEPNGGVAIVQLENEYFWGDVPYHIKLADLARGLGVKVPLYTNVNRYARNTMYIDALDLYPSPWDLDSVVNSIRDLLETQGPPPKILEYEGGWFSVIYRPLPTSRGSFPPQWTRMLLATALAYGSDVVSFYMFHGGTNFGYWTGRWITTTYDYEASIREWGELSERYYNVKLLTPLAELIDGSVAESESYSNGRLLVVRRKGDLRLKFYINNTDSEWVDGDVKVKARGVKVIPVNLQVKGALIKEANLSLLGIFNGDVLLYGDVGEEFTVRISNASAKSCIGVSSSVEGGDLVLRGRVPSELAGCLIEGRGTFRLLILSEQYASRTWSLDKYYVVSNIYLVRDGDFGKVTIEAKDGLNIAYVPFKSSSGKYIPELDMTRVEIPVNVDEPQISVLRALQGNANIRHVTHVRGIRPLEELGIFKHGIYEYGFRVDEGGLAGFVVHDYAVVVNNGVVKSSGFIYVKANVEPGELKVIAESTGHPNDGQLPFFTGLQSPLLLNLTKTITVDSWEYGILDLSNRVKPGIASNYSHTMVANREIREYLPQVKWVKSVNDLGKPSNAVVYYRARVNVGEGGYLVVRVTKAEDWTVMAVFINGEEVYRGHGDGPFETTVYAGFRKGDVELVIAVLRYGIRSIPEKPGNVQIDVWGRAIDEADLAILEPGSATEITQLQGIKLSEPRTYRIEFTVKKPTDVNSPIYLNIRGDALTLIYLNGMLIGRYYPSGPQEKYYLPEPYLRDVNEVTLVAIPSKQDSSINISFGYYFKTRIIDVNL
mgnify:CR=1 FL=1